MLDWIIAADLTRLEKLRRGAKSSEDGVKLDQLIGANRKPPDDRNYLLDDPFHSDLSTPRLW